MSRARESIFKIIRKIQSKNSPGLTLTVIKDYADKIDPFLYETPECEFLVPKIQSAKTVLQDRLIHYEDDMVLFKQMELWKYFQAFETPFSGLTDPADIQQIVPDRKRAFLNHTAEFFKRALFIEPSPELLYGLLYHWAYANALGRTLEEGMTETGLLLMYYQGISRKILSVYDTAEEIYENNDNQTIFKENKDSNFYPL